MILMRTTGRHGNADYSYFFCRGVQDHTCDAPYSSIDRVEDAIAEHYKTIRLSPAFVTAVRSHIESALNDQAAAQQLLRKNLEDQLAQLTAKEDNLLDLAADGSLPQDRIRQRLRDIARDRQRITEQLSQVHGDLSGGRAFLDVHLDLLENPYELYLHASDAIRRKLNRAIFAHVYVAHDEVVGDDIRSPLRELLAAERGWEALTAGATPEVARSTTQAATARHSGPETPKAAPKGGMAELQNLWLELPGGIYEDADCSKPLMVDAMERCGNRRPRVQELVSAWNQGICEDAESEDRADDPWIGASAEPRKRPRTRLTDTEVDAMRTARAQGVSVNALARQFGVHRGTVWAKTR